MCLRSPLVCKNHMCEQYFIANISFRFTVVAGVFQNCIDKTLPLIDLPSTLLVQYLYIIGISSITYLPSLVNVVNECSF